MGSRTRCKPGVPVLLPTGHGALRARLDQWFERNGLHPQVVGEFEDSALLKTFGAGGMGVFPAAERVFLAESFHWVSRVVVGNAPVGAEKPPVASRYARDVPRNPAFAGTLGHDTDALRRLGRGR